MFFTDTPISLSIKSITMAHDENLANRIREALAGENLEEKKMFSGLAFLVNGKMCVNTTKNGMMCRIDPALHEKVIEEKACRPVFMKGREYKGWLLVDPKNLKTEKDFDHWIDLALDFNPKAKRSKKRKPKTSSNE